MTKWLQFGAKSVIIGGIDANLLFSFLTINPKLHIIHLKPAPGKAIQEIGVSVIVNRAGFLLSKIGDAKCYTELLPRFTPSLPNGTPAGIAAMYLRQIAHTVQSADTETMASDV